MVDVKKTMHKGNKNRVIAQNFKSRSSDWPNKRTRDSGETSSVWLLGWWAHSSAATGCRPSCLRIASPFSNYPLLPCILTPLTSAIQVHPSFKFTSVMFKLRTFRYGGGCLQKQERCCRACDSQINPRLYDSTEARERWTLLRDQHCSDRYATSLNLASEISTKKADTKSAQYYKGENVTFLRKCDKCMCP